MTQGHVHLVRIPLQDQRMQQSDATRPDVLFYKQYFVFTLGLWTQDHLLRQASLDSVHPVWISFPHPTFDTRVSSESVLTNLHVQIV